MEDLTPEEQEELADALEVVEKGPVGIVKFLVKLSRKVDKVLPTVEEMLSEHEEEVEAKLENTAARVEASVPDLAKALSEVRGNDGLTPKKGVDYFDGENYILSEADKREIARQIEVPVVEKVIERTEVIKEQPIVQETVHNTTIENPVTPDQAVDKVNASLRLIKKERVEGLIDLMSNVAHRALEAALPATTSFFNGLRAKNLTIVGATAVQKGDTVEVTVASSGGGSFALMQPTGTVNGVNTSFTFASAPSVIVVDQGRIMQKVSSDGTVNWAGTTAVVLSVAPMFDIFGY